MSDLTKMYDELRVRSSHEAAMHEMARRIGVDGRTIERVLERARRTESVSAPSPADRPPVSDGRRSDQPPRRSSRRSTPGRSHHSYDERTT